VLTWSENRGGRMCVSGVWTGERHSRERPEVTVLEKFRVRRYGVSDRTGGGGERKNLLLRREMLVYSSVSNLNTDKKNHPRKRVNCPTDTRGSKRVYRRGSRETKS